MTLWLDGGFWGPWIRKEFVREIEWTRRAVLEHMLPSIPDPATEAERAADEAWASAMSCPSDGSEDFAGFAEWARDQGIAVYERLSGVRQAAANMAAVMLWHLLEQQMLMFHIRQVLQIGEEWEVRQDVKQRNRLFTLGEFHSRLEAGGCSMRALPSWPKVEELKLVANAVKHGPGGSLDKLYAIRRDLLDMPGTEDPPPTFQPEPSWVERPAGGQDIYVRDRDLAAYFDAATSLWQEFSAAIERHSARR